MMYAYRCDECEKNFDVIKDVSHHRRKENCPECKMEARRLFLTSCAIVDNTQPEYYHSLGKVIKNKYERKEAIKMHDLVEVGSEKPKSMHKMFAKQREQKRINSWNEV